jgi:hypothetical protein
MKESEVIDAFDSEAGLVVAMFDGTQFIIVPDDRPDAEGKTGLMFFTAPDVPGDKGYTGDFPVYAQPLETDPADVVGGDIYPEKGNAAAVLQWVAGDQERAEFALEQENAKTKPARVSSPSSRRSSSSTPRPTAPRAPKRRSRPRHGAAEAEAQ